MSTNHRPKPTDLAVLLEHAERLVSRAEPLVSNAPPSFSLMVLRMNLRELHDRHQAGDGDAALREFFQIYTVAPEPARLRVRGAL